MKYSTILLTAVLASTMVGGAAQAADLIIDEAPVADVAVSGYWDGAYAGIFGGRGSGELTEDLAGASLDGWLLGATAGYNFTLDGGLVVGVAGDVAWSTLETTPDFFTLDWTGSVRGRVGYDAGMFLPYLTAGVAFGSATETLADRSKQHFGWTAGIGAEVAVSDNLSIDAQYRYTDLGDVDYAGNLLGYQYSQITVGLNFKF